MIFSGPSVGLMLVTIRSEHLRGNFSASLRDVSSWNWSMKLLLPIADSLCCKSSSPNLSGSVGCPVSAPSSMSSCNCGAISPS